MEECLRVGGAERSARGRGDSARALRQGVEAWLRGRCGQVVGTCGCGSVRQQATSNS